MLAQVCWQQTGLCGEPVYLPTVVVFCRKQASPRRGQLGSTGEVSTNLRGDWHVSTHIIRVWVPKYRGRHVRSHPK